MFEEQALAPLALELLGGADGIPAELPAQPFPALRPLLNPLPIRGKGRPRALRGRGRGRGSTRRNPSGFEHAVEEEQRDAVPSTAPPALPQQQQQGVVDLTGDMVLEWVWLWQ